MSMQAMKSLNDAIVAVADRLDDGVLRPTLAHLAFFLKFKNEPFSLRQHYMFEPMFEFARPRRDVWKCGRQVGKTLNRCASNGLMTVATPFFNTLYVCPRFEQIKRISNNYVRVLLQESDFKWYMIDQDSSQSVLQRNFRNRSVQYFSFAFLDTDRIRNIAADMCIIDEVQDIVWDFIPVIEETMSGSPTHGYRSYTGTPKTLENTIERIWQESSQAEWCIKCTKCGKWNIPDIEHHLLRMIGATTCICRACGKPLDCRPPNGMWVHKYQDLRSAFSGFHIPQVIMPHHYEEPNNWVELIHKQHNYPEAKFYNECLGISWDTATKLVDMNTLREISRGGDNNLKGAIRRKKEFHILTMGIDWGGGGGDESKSYTVVSVCGQRLGSDVIECIYLERLHEGLQQNQEIALILQYVQMFNPAFLAHDYTGAGSSRDVMLKQAGVPEGKIVPFTYAITASEKIIQYRPKTTGTRKSYTMDKPRSLVVLCTMIRARKIILPKWENSSNVTKDLLNLVEERQERPTGGDVVLVKKTPGESDDFAHSLNYACSAIWYAQQSYPNVAEAMHIRLTQEAINEITPVNPNWS